MLRRAHTVLQVKSVNDEQRLIEGFASTPTPDAIGDVMDPLGAVYTLPMKLLLQHDRERPIGSVTAVKRSPDGLWITAQVEKNVPPALAYIDVAWEQIKRKLVDGLSIGWQPLTKGLAKDGQTVWAKWRWAETSTVTLPMNAEATIALVKSLDDQALAALGTAPSSVSRPSPGASGSRSRTTMTTNPTERIDALTAERTPLAARMSELMQPVIDQDAELGADEKTEFEALKKSVATIDEKLEYLQSLQKATPVALAPVNGTSRAKAAESRAQTITVAPPELPKGTAFTRYCIALARAKGNVMQAAQIARMWRDSTPDVEFCLKSAVEAGTTTDATWAGNLVQYSNMSGEFAELLRPRTIIGRIPGLRRTPFNVSIPAQTAGGTYGWVGQGAPKPVGQLATDLILLRWAKAAGIIVLTDELVRFSNPSAEALVRDDMLNGMQQFLDEQFTDPAVAAVTDVSPASITNGAPTSAAAGTTFTNFIADVKEALASMGSANISPSGVVILMTEAQAISLSLVRNALGVSEAPNLSATGGSVLGMTVVASDSVPAGHVIYLKPSEIFFSDDGGVTIDVSREASVQMDSAPSPGAQSLVSFWQNNLVGLRAERFINWKRRLTQAVYYHTSANYGS